MSWLSWLPDLSAIDFTEPLTAYLRGNELVAYLVLGATTLPPLVPNSAILVTGGVLAANGRLNILAVVAVVALSALLGDMLIHRCGRAMSASVIGRLYRRPRRRALLEWTSDRIERNGIPFVVACRFLPSGRLFGGLAAGIVRFPARRYLIGALIAEVLWASYMVGLGYFGGQATSNSLYAVGVGIGVSALVALIGGLVQWAARRRDRAVIRPVSDHPVPSRPVPAVAGRAMGGAGAQGASGSPAGPLTGTRRPPGAAGRAGQERPAASTGHGRPCEASARRVITTGSTALLAGRRGRS